VGGYETSVGVKKKREKVISNGLNARRQHRDTLERRRGGKEFGKKGGSEERVGKAELGAKNICILPGFKRTAQGGEPRKGKLTKKTDNAGGCVMPRK